ncbi:MAG: hypothetical protein JXB39_07140 [Deltaproteobacteria bacterium]|nr:hypothetical protein [Deltaproteobacteria bacterium]
MPSPPPLLTEVLSAWAPLALAWFLMGLELPLAAAVIARLPDPVVNLAALGGVIFPLAFVVEAPIILLLTAANALCGDIPSYRLVRRFTVVASGVLVTVHLTIAATPVYSLVVDGLLGVPPEVSVAARPGLLLMLPFAPAIAWRRFQQGVLVRFGRSRAVGAGTAVRLLADVVVLVLGVRAGLPGVMVGTAAIATGVVVEAIYASTRVRSVVRGPLTAAPPADPPLTWRAFRAFYVPLMLSPMIALAGAPLVSAALARMPRALDSLAAWSVVMGFLFLFRGPGIAAAEVVVALLPRPGAAASLRRFSWIAAGGLSGMFLAVIATPLDAIWMSKISGLTPALGAFACAALPWLVAVPGLTVLQNAVQGVLVHRRRTRAVTESVAAFLVVNLALLGLGVFAARWAGLPVGLIALAAGTLAQAAWLGLRARERPPTPALAG